MAGTRFVGPAGVGRRKCPAIADTHDHFCVAKKDLQGYKTWTWGRSWMKKKMQGYYRREVDNTNQWQVGLGGKSE